MQNIDIRFRASQTGFKGVEAQMEALTAQAAMLGETINKTAYAKAPALVDPAAWQKGTDAVSRASREYLRAVSSSNLLNATQIRATSQTKTYTEALQKQKLTLGDMIKNRQIMTNVYKDQLRIQRMTSQYWGTDQAGRAVQTITVPKNVPKDLDTMRRRMGMFGNMAASASTQMVNLGKNIQWSGRQLMVGFTYPMVLFGAAAGVMAYKTEKAFGAINKVYDVTNGANATSAQRTAELNKLRADSMDMASQAARDYGSTLQSTLEVEQRLAATGLKGTELLGATKDTQRISALGDIDSSQSADMIVALKTAFKGEIGNDASKLTNTLNYFNQVSNATSLSLQDIAVAVPKVGTMFAQLGGTTKDLAVLMVSMRESGVDMAEGANAIKSAASRIIDPVPKAIKYYKQFGITLEDISKQSGGNVVKFLKILGMEQQKIVGNTEKETNRLRQIGIKDLFGVYQVGKLTSSLVNLTDAYGGVNNQSSKALEIGKESNDELAKQAKASQELMMNNPAGKLKRAWAEFGIELQKVGGPFLEVATKIVGGLTWIAEKFNGMAGWKKKALLAAAGLLAIVGPLIMLTGLFVNLAGQAGKGASWLLRLVGISELLTEKQKAEALATEQQNLMMQNQIGTTSTLVTELRALTEAYALLNKEKMTGAMTVPGGAGTLSGVSTMSMGAATKGTIPITMPSTPSGDPRITPPLAPIPSGVAAPLTPQNTPLLQGARKSEILMANERAGERAAQAKATALEERRIADQKAAQLRLQGGINQKVNAMNVGLGIGGLAMAGMLASSMGMLGPMNGFVGEASKLAFIGILVVPALTTTIKLIKAGIVATKVWAAAQLVLAERAAAVAAATAISAGGGGLFAGAGAGVKALGSSIAGLMGPIGWVTLGVTAIGLGIFAWKKHLDAVHAAEVKAHRDIINFTDDWAKSVGKVSEAYGDLGYTIGDVGDANKQAALQDSYTDKKGAYYDGLQDFKKMDSGDKQDFATQHYLELVGKIGQTSKDSMNNIRALYAAAGMSAEDAEVQVQRLTMAYGKMSKAQAQAADFRADASSLKSTVGPLDILHSSDDNIDQIKDSGKAAAESWARAFASAEPGSAASKALIAQLKAAAEGGWDKAMSGDSLGKNQAGFLKAMGITDAQSMKAAIARAGGLDNFWKTGGEADKVGRESGSTVLPTQRLIFTRNIEKAQAAEQSLIGGIASINTGVGKTISDNTKDFDDLAANFILKYGAMSKAQQDSWVSHSLGNLKSIDMMKGMGVDPAKLGAQEEAIKAQVNLINKARGFKEGATAADAIANFMGKVVDKTAAANIKAKALAGTLNGIADLGSINIDVAGAVNITKKSMGNMQSMMVDGANAAFDAKWQGTEDAATARNKKRSDGIEAARKKAQDAIQKQIDAEKKADDIRQKLFENEKARLQQIADLMNSQIDFDAAVNTGNLDEAAKIQNNMVVTTQGNQMDKDNDTAQAASDKKVAALEKREKQIDKIYDRRAKAAEKAADAEMKSIAAAKDADKASLDERMALFSAYTARNQKDLEAWMKKLGLKYSDFGTNLSANSGDWASTFQGTLSKQLRIAGTEVASDQIWANIGQESVKQLMQALGFKGAGQFANFVNTGVLPKNFTGDPYKETKHGGGMVGDGRSSRGNIPNTYKGLHKSETMVRAQNGEFIVNRKAAKYNREALENMNKGIYGGEAGNATIADRFNAGTPTFGGVYGLIAGMQNSMMQKGVARAMGRGIAMNSGIPMAGAGNATSADMGNGLGGYVPGAGGRHFPTSPGGHGGIHDASTGYPAVDFPRPVGSPAYAVADGVISRSMDLRGNEPRRAGYGKAQDGFRSYGRVMYLKTNAGPEVLYAHLSQRGLGAGAKVKGGSVIGKTGDTGNSTGPHLHFGSKGASPLAWLREGGEIKWDNTQAVLHKGESVLTKSLTQKFKDNVASAGNTEYTMTIDLRGAYIKEDVDLEKAVDTAIAKREAKVGRRKVVK